MTRRGALIAFAAAGLLLSAVCSALGQNAPEEPSKPLPFVSPIFGDNAVLWRGKADTIWGWSDPGDKIRVEVAGKSVSGVAGNDRRWQVEIQPSHVGGPYPVKITGRQRVELRNVFVGPQPSSTARDCPPFLSGQIPGRASLKAEGRTEGARVGMQHRLSARPQARRSWRNRPSE